MKTLTASVISLVVGFAAGHWIAPGNRQAPEVNSAAAASSHSGNAPSSSQATLADAVKKAPRDEQVRIATAVFLEWEEDLKKQQLDLAVKLYAVKAEFLNERPDIATLERYLEHLSNWRSKNDPEGVARLSEWLTSGTEEERKSRAAYESKLEPLFNVMGMARFVMDENNSDAAFAEYRQEPPPASLGKNVFARADGIAGVVMEDSPVESWQARMEKRRAAYRNYLDSFSAEQNVPPEIVEALQTRGYVNMAGMIGRDRLERALEGREDLAAIKKQLNDVSNRLESVTNTRGGFGLLFPAGK